MPFETPAQWGSLIEVSGTSGEQYTSNVTALKNGSFVVVWTRHDGAQSDIFMQILNADGSTRGSPTQVNTTDGGKAQNLPVVTGLENGGFAIAWLDSSGVDQDVRARVYGSDGEALNEDFIVGPTSSTGDQKPPTIAALGSGFVIVNGGYGGSQGQAVNVYDGLGNRTGGVDLEGGNYTSTAVTALSDTRFVAVSYQELGSDDSIQVRVQTKDEPVDIWNFTPPGGAPFSSIGVTALSGGRFMVVWKENDLSATDKIKARIYTSRDTFEDVTLVDSSVRLEKVVVSTTSDGGYAVAYSTVAGDVKGRVFGANFANDANQASDIFNIRAESGVQSDPSISVLADGRFVVSWDDDGGQPGGPPFIRSQIFDARAAAVTVNGTNGADVYYGTDYNVDQLSGRGGNDILDGGAGHDLLIGGAGEDVLNGGDGGDWAVYTDATAGVTADLTANTAALSRARNTGDAMGDVYNSIENLRGSTHGDVLIGDNASNELEGMAGEDTLFGGAGADKMDGGANYDQVSYQRSTAAILIDLTDADGSENKGDAKDDRFISIDAYIGSTFSDTMIGGDKEDEFYGGANGDRLEGGLNHDHLFGEAGNDTLEGGAGNDELNGGAGTNTAVFSGRRSEYTISNPDANGRVTITGADRVDTVKDVRVLRFESAGRVEEIALTNTAPTGLQLVGSSIVENAAPGRAEVGTLSARDADGDTLTYSLAPGSSSAFAIVGNKLVVNGPLDHETQPNHQVTIQASDRFGGTTSLKVNLTVTDDTSETTPFTLWGTPGVDVLTGEAGNDTIYGSGANDVLSGMAGNDKIHGGTGNDLLSGGAGKDVFVFDMRANKRTNVDKISDFRYQDDSIYLENRYFTKLGSGTASKPKKFKSDMFVQNTKAQDAEDRIVYDKRSGKLYYDEDGTGAKAQIHIATLTNKATLKYSDLFVI